MDQITSDHSFVNHLVMTGQITKDEAFHHPQRNIITKVKEQINVFLQIYLSRELIL